MPDIRFGVSFIEGCSNRDIGSPIKPFAEEKPASQKMELDLNTGLRLRQFSVPALVCSFIPSTLLECLFYARLCSGPWGQSVSELGGVPVWAWSRRRSFIKGTTAMIRSWHHGREPVLLTWVWGGIRKDTPVYQSFEWDSILPCICMTQPHSPHPNPGSASPHYADEETEAWRGYLSSCLVIQGLLIEV